MVKMGSGQSNLENVSQNETIRNNICEATKNDDSFTFSVHFDESNQQINNIDFLLWIIQLSLSKVSLNILNNLHERNLITREILNESIIEYMENNYPNNKVLYWVYENFPLNQSLINRMKPFLKIDHSRIPIYEPTPIIENPHPIIENKTPILENTSPILENPPPIIENPPPIIENPPPIIENKTPILESLPRVSSFKKNKVYHLEDKDYEPIEINQDMIIFSKLE
jgi:hypothetical protein